MGGLSAPPKEDSPLARFSKMRIIGKSWADPQVNLSHLLRHQRQFALIQQPENKRLLPLPAAWDCVKPLAPTTR